MSLSLLPLIIFPRVLSEVPAVAVLVPRMPPPYTLDVSTRLPPAAKNMSSVVCESLSFIAVPKKIVPSPRRETSRPDFPRLQYSIASPENQFSYRPHSIRNDAKSRCEPMQHKLE